ncbi:putative quinol monooxygenase [Candidatus Nitrosocosmicus sp. T]
MHDSENIRFRAEYIVSQEKLQEYKKLIQELCKVVEAKEPHTLEYQFYFNDDETKCVVHETYTNSEAALAHNDGIASKTILPKILEISQINRFEVYGNPCEKLQKVLSRFNTQKFSIFTGFSR